MQVFCGIPRLDSHQKIANVYYVLTSFVYHVIELCGTLKTTHL